MDVALGSLTPEKQFLLNGPRTIRSGDSGECFDGIMMAKILRSETPNLARWARWSTLMWVIHCLENKEMARASPGSVSQNMLSGEYEQDSTTQEADSFHGEPREYQSSFSRGKNKSKSREVPEDNFN